MATNVGNPQPTLAFPSVDSKLAALEGVVTPGTFLAESIGREVVVRLKGGQEYTGTLVSYDNYYNLRLKNCIEKSREGRHALSSLNDVFIRCTSVHLIYAIPLKVGDS